MRDGKPPTTVWQRLALVGLSGALAVAVTAAAPRAVACSASATNCAVSCSTPPGSWGGSCSGSADRVSCTWTQSCGAG